jgi:hypothetical protein
MVRRSFFFVALIGAVAFAADTAEAQRSYQPLFDKFNLKVEGSWMGLGTEVRLDSEVLGTGTTLSFEDDLNLDASKTIPTFGFEWQAGKRHRLGVRWQDLSRNSTSQTLTEIKWGDDTIPIDANITLAFDVIQAFVDYAFYPWVKEKWAAGFGLGLRWMEIQATLAWREENVGEEGSSNVEGTGPVPYLYFEYRRLFGEKWRLIAGVGWLQVTIEDIDGGQYIGRLGGEYLLGRRWAFGAAFNFSTIDVDWAGVQTEEDESLLTAAINIDVNDFSVFVRLRF